jgi:thioredoxin 1
VRKKSINQIIVVCAVLICIAGIWLVKNSNIKSEASKPAVASSDFSLNIVNEIDMPRMKSYGIPIMIDFGADSCIPCKKMAPILAKLNKELQGKAIVRFVDVWKHGKLANGFPVRLIPTQIFIDSDGNSYKPSQSVLSKISFQSSVINGVRFTFHEGGLEEDDIITILNDMGMK